MTTQVNDIIEVSMEIRPDIPEEEGKISEAIVYYEKDVAIDSTLEQAKTNKKNADAKLQQSKAVS